MKTNMPCPFKHNYKLVNNRYKNGKQVIENGEWVTEKVCEKCGEVYKDNKLLCTKKETN